MFMRDLNEEALSDYLANAAVEHRLNCVRPAPAAFKLMVIQEMVRHRPHSVIAVAA